MNAIDLTYRLFWFLFSATNPLDLSNNDPSSATVEREGFALVQFFHFLNNNASLCNFVLNAIVKAASDVLPTSISDQDQVDI